MPKKKSARHTAARAKALLLPMPRQRAAGFVLRARLALERLRNGEVDRPLVNQLGLTCMITGFITEAGYGTLRQTEIEQAQHGLAQLLLGYGQMQQWPDASPELIDELTAVVNEYDRMLATVRLEIIAQATEHVDRLMAIVAAAPPSVAQLSRTFAPDASGSGAASTPASSPSHRKP
ncbi:hypothetical protein [Paraburkholderia tropica]|uniref:hypothetical protein n=1 Tax=Paraburkholderia tropica TaxID=92647 RepID=UPI002AB05687|nr:hypothetical protein [Paraburkholderia tropica]